MATRVATDGASGVGAKPASGTPLIGDTADLLAQLHQNQALLETAGEAPKYADMSPA